MSVIAEPVVFAGRRDTRVARMLTDHAFWDRERIAIVVNALRDAKETLENSPEALAKYFASLAPAADLPDATGLRRLLNGRTVRPQRSDRLFGLMRALVELYGIEDTRGFPAATRDALCRLSEEHDRISKSRNGRGGALAIATGQDGSIDAGTFVQSLASILKTDFLEVKRAFFVEDDDPHKPLAYLMYRFDTKPGRVLKSFLELRPPSDDRQACIFNHAARVPRQVRYRRTTGIVLPFGNTLSFVGQMTDGPGLKVMTIGKPAAARERYHGLLLSFDEKDIPVSSRFVMVRTNHAAAADAGIGVFQEDELTAEIADFRAEMRNEIAFVGDRQVFNKGKALSQSQIIELVEERLRAAGDELVDAEGRPFTPVATLAAAYNAALRIARD